MSLSNCLTTNVETYLTNGCPQLVAELGDSNYWSSLFSLFYGDRQGLYDANNATVQEIYFQDLLADMSKDVRVVTYTGSQWTNRCAATPVAATTSVVAQDPYLRKICGCYWQGPCGALCTSFSVPPVNTAGEVETCAKNICRIDNLTIQALNSSTLGNINLQQLCPFCLSPSSCICQINNLVLNVESSSVGNLQINQMCDPQLSSINGLPVNQALQQYGSTFSPQPQVNSDKVKTWLLLTLSVILLIIIFIMIVIVSRQPPTIITVPFSPYEYLALQQEQLQLQQPQLQLQQVQVQS